MSPQARPPSTVSAGLAAGRPPSVHRAMLDVPSTASAILFEGLVPPLDSWSFAVIASIALSQTQPHPGGLFSDEPVEYRC